MTTLSVPISSELEIFINNMIKDGRAANKADVVRKALRQLSEDELVEKIIRARREPTIRGDLRILMKKFK